MELPQPRPFGAEGRKTTHDFLSLYSPVQQDPRPSQGGYFKTHDFLQPLEQLGKNVAKEENNIEVAFIEKPPPSAPPSPPSVKHILPGGIGTYSICYNDQRVPKPEGSLFTVARESSADRNDENSNCSSYTGSGFTLWDESSTKKGKTGKENISADRHVVRETGVNLGGGQWKTPLERPSQSFSSHKLNSMALSSLPSSQPSSAQKSRGLINMLKSSKAGQEEEEDDDDEEEIVIKKEPSSHLKGNLSLKVDGKSTDQKPNTPRSKHSATEQRRRSKINDRFQRLREIIPNSDQKRDKASFLLEVIEYIQYLQEKVHKYEGPYQGWNHEPPKLMTWGKCYRTGEGFIEQSQCANSGSAQAAIFSTKFDDNKNGFAQTISVNGQQLVDSEIRTIATPKEHSQQPESINKAASCPLQLQHDIFPFRESSSAAASISMGAAPDINKRASDLQSQYWQNGSCATDCAVASDHKQKDHEQTIESGSISVSSAYSRGLLSSLTKALQNSGVDLSQASISVEIDLGKKAANSRPYSSASAPKDDNVSMSNQAISHPISADMGQEPDRALKRLKTSRS